MEKYKWSPEKIDDEDFFYTQELEFGEWSNEVSSEPVYQYADQLPF
ncbi:hypothetical protein I6N95_04985 [Vagococcus sp. BWB3-3]|uniref:Uncharacterized protein n=1 Tax=Vagococcus allomyrinae TaxID=2794353 RepID=A0A940SU46_9ENTE|nr:hypothetical protein [Vagococcus allomyrinae]